MAGGYDANGVYFYDETDPWPTTAEVLNVAQQATSDAIEPLLTLKADAYTARTVATAAAADALASATAAQNAARALDTVGGVIYEDATDAGLYLIAAGAPITLDPAEPGLYLIGT